MLDKQGAPVQLPSVTRRGMAERFIAALAGSADAAITFQTFTDTGESETPAAIIHGRLADVWERLEDLQECGHGIFVLINEGDGKGRREENVVALRALFADDDTGAVRLTQLGCPPSIAVASGNGAHYYWLLRAGERLEGFTPAQRGIAAKLGTDIKVSDVCRVLRVPGTFNLKDRSRPQPVELVLCKPERRYTIAEVLAGLSASPNAPERTGGKGVQPPQGPLVLGSSDRLRAESYIATIEAVEGDGGDLNTYRAACALLRDFGLSETTAWECLKGWNATNASPPWSEKALGVKFRNARSYGKGPMNSKLAELIGAAVEANAEAAVGRMEPGNPKLNPANWCFDESLTSSAWRYYDPETLTWRDGTAERSLDRLLENEGKLNRAGIAAWKKRVACVDRAEPVYSSTDRIVVVNKVKLANTYRRPTLERREGADWAPIGAVLLNLVNGDQKAYLWLLGWLGKLVQNVHAGSPRRIGTAPVFFGAKGTGKGVLETVCKALIGPWNVVSIGQRELTSDFNSVLEGKLLVFANEVWAAETKGGALLSKLKDAIAGADRRVINAKGVKEYERDVVENWILSSNSYRPVEVEKGDRRLVVFKTGPAIPVRLGAQVADDARAGGPMVRAFLAYLLALPAEALADDYRPLETDAKEAVRAASGTSATRFAAEVAALGFWSCTGAWAGGARITTSDLYLPGRELAGTPVLQKRRLLDVYRAWASEQGSPAVPEAGVLAALREEVPGMVEAHALIDGRRERVVAGLPGMLPEYAPEVETEPKQRSLI